MVGSDANAPTLSRMDDSRAHSMLTFRSALRGARHATNVYNGLSSFVFPSRHRKSAPVFTWSGNPNGPLAQQARFASRRRRSIDVVKRSFLVFFKSRYGSHLATSECQVISVHTIITMRAVLRGFWGPGPAADAPWPGGLCRQNCGAPPPK